MSKIHKNKKNRKIVLNTAEDLLEITREDFDKINISNLTGKYYEQIYKEALEIEQKRAIKKNKKNTGSKKKNGVYGNPKAKIITNINAINNENKTNTLKSNLRRNNGVKLLNRGSRSKSKEKYKNMKKANYKIIANNINVNITSNINNKKHVFSPEFYPKINPFEYKNIKNKKSNNININSDEEIEFDSSSINNEIQIDLLSTFKQINNNDDKILYSLIEPKQNYIKHKSDDITNNKKFNNESKINKIIFYIKYDSNYGDNIGILGSIEELGNWQQDKILYLKWSKGNIWTGFINIKDSDASNFEFKFINRNDGIIYWEKGFNNVVDLDGLIEEIRYQKKGRYNKYEYIYDENNSEIKLICKIKGWE